MQFRRNKVCFGLQQAPSDQTTSQQQYIVHVAIYVRLHRDYIHRSKQNVRITPLPSPIKGAAVNFRGFIQGNEYIRPACVYIILVMVYQMKNGNVLERALSCSRGRFFQKAGMNGLESRRWRQSEPRNMKLYSSGQKFDKNLQQTSTTFIINYVDISDIIRRA